MTETPTAAPAPADSLSIRDNRTGRDYEIAITDGTIRAADLKQIAVEGEPGIATYDPGFVNTASCRSAVTFIDGDVGILEYRGYPIEQLAEHSTFLEVAYLLLNGELPTQAQLDDWVHDVTHHTFIHENLKQFIQGFRYDAHPMGMLMASVSALSTFYPTANEIADPEDRQPQITRMIAKMPTLGAFAFRHQQGKPYVYPDNALSYTANFLAMLFKMSEPDLPGGSRGWCRRSRCCSSCTPTTSRTARPTPCARWAPPRSIRTRQLPPASGPSTARCTAGPTRPYWPCCGGSAAPTTSPTSSPG